MLLWGAIGLPSNVDGLSVEVQAWTVYAWSSELVLNFCMDVTRRFQPSGVS
jgi:hypothetical protein